MDLGPYPVPKCRLEGCQLGALVDRPYCLEHQRRESLLKAMEAAEKGPHIKTTPQPERDSTVHSPPRQHPSPAPEDVKRIDSSHQKLGDAITVHSPATAPTSPNSKRQLSDKHVARKTAKVSSHQGLPYEQASPTSNRTSAAENSLSTLTSRPTKLKPSMGTNRPDPHVLNPSATGDRCRMPSESVPGYSEEGHGGLESGFRLRPENISLDESSKAKRHVDQGSVLDRERTYKSPPRNLYAPNNNVRGTRFPGHAGDKSVVIDLTEDDVGAHHCHRHDYPAPAHGRPTNGHIIHRHGHFNGFNKASSHNPAPHRREENTRAEVRTNHRLRSPPLGHFGSKRKLQDFLPSNRLSPGSSISPSNNLAQEGVKGTAPSVQPRPNPESSQRQLEHPIGLSQTPRPTIKLGGLSSSEPRLGENFQKNEAYASKRGQSPLPNPPGRPSMNGSHTSATWEKPMTPPNVQSRVPGNQITIEPDISRTPKISGIHREHQPRPHTPLNPLTTSNEPIRPPHNGPSSSLPRPLSTHLQQNKRSWKHLTPEERRQARVAQHDPVLFDSYIYGDLNRPNRPGDPLFYMPDYAQPPRPTRPATHFAYIDPRVHWRRSRSEQWKRNKREEMAARGRRKAEGNFGRAALHVARRKAAEAEAEIKDLQPEKVRNDPQWMAAVREMDEMAAAYHEQARQKDKDKDKDKDMDKDKGKEKDKRERKGKERSASASASGTGIINGTDADDMDMDVDVDVNVDVDMDESREQSEKGGEWSFINRVG
ncbi:hypothetical protein F4810DRAFT_90194 [Camillea tinctor]|nr:hypothetical protein F4810DRAFT_90194 [Camillea tinctor]